MTGWLERPVRLICILPCREVHVTWSLDFTDSLWFHRLRHWEVDSHPPPDNIDMNSPYLGGIDFSCFVWLWWCLQGSAGKWIWGHNFVNDLHLFRMLELCVAFKAACEHICTALGSPLPPDAEAKGWQDFTLQSTLVLSCNVPFLPHRLCLRSHLVLGR